MNIKKDELEFFRVRKLVASYANSPEAKEAVLSRPVKTNQQAVTSLLTETKEMTVILEHRLHIPFIASDSLQPILIKVKKGFVLKPNELEKVADFIRVTRLLIRFFDKNRLFAPTIASYSDGLVLLDKTETEIYAKIEHAQVSDQADRDLARFRKQNADLKDKIKEALNHVLQSKTYRNYLQDNMIIKNYRLSRSND